MSKKIQTTRTVNASPEQLFGLLSTPTRHTEFDGASMLRGIEGSADQINGVGDEFVMKMHNDALGDYKMRNKVVAFEPNRVIGWAPSLDPIDGYTDKVGDMKATGHVFTWELEAAGDGQTKVTQTYDWSAVTDEAFLGMLPLLNEDQLSSSIDRAADAAK